MDDSNNNSSLPDISGVFHIDESKIPPKAITPENEPTSLSKDYEPILIPKAEETVKSGEKNKKKKSRRPLNKKQKALRKRLIIAVCLAVLVLGGIFGIKYAVDLSKRPVGQVGVATSGTISSHYDTKALLYSDAVAQGEVKTVGVFIDNNYDLYSVAKGQRVEVYVSQTVSVSGEVLNIEKISVDSPVLEKIRRAFPEGEYSSGANYLITVKTQLDGSAFENKITDIRIITARAEKAVIVPTEAIRKEGNSAYVWVYNGFTKEVEKRPVTTGISSDELTQITDGIKPHTKVILAFDRDEELIRDSMKIKTAKGETAH